MHLWTYWCKKNKRYLVIQIMLFFIETPINNYSFRFYCAILFGWSEFIAEVKFIKTIGTFLLTKLFLQI